MFNCRTVGRCTYGAPIDRELHDMVPMDEDGNVLDLSQDTNRHFLYVRYNVELNQQGMESIGISDIDPEPLRALDSVKTSGQTQ